VAEQVAVLLATTDGLFDALPVEQVADAEARVRDAVREQLPDRCAAIAAGEALDDADRRALLNVARDALEPLTKEADDGDA
jgi:F-type H+-transporting ATPase subunit alpha